MKGCTRAEEVEDAVIGKGLQECGLQAEISMRRGDAQLTVALNGSMNKEGSLDLWWIQAIYFANF